MFICLFIYFCIYLSIVYSHLSAPVLWFLPWSCRLCLRLNGRLTFGEDGYTPCIREGGDWPRVSPKRSKKRIYVYLWSSNIIYVPQRRFGPVLLLFIFDSCWTATVRSCVLRTDRRETQQRTVLGCRTTVRSACSCRPSTWVRGSSSWFAPSATSKFSSKKYANCRSPIRSMPPMKFSPPGTTFLVLDFFILGSHMRSTWQVRLRKTVPWVVARKCANSASNWWGSPDGEIPELTMLVALGSFLGWFIENNYVILRPTSFNANLSRQRLQTCGLCMFISAHQGF